MIKLNKQLPYGEVIGDAHDNARYRQGKYRFTSDGRVIGDSIALEKADKEEKIATMRAALEAQMREVAQMDEEIQKISGSSDVISPAAQEVITPAPANVPGIHFQTAPKLTPVAPAPRPLG